MPKHENQSKTAPRYKANHNKGNYSSKGVYVYRHYNERTNEFTNYCYDPKEHGDSEEWLLVLRQMDKEEELRERYNRENADYRFQNAQSRYSANPDDFDVPPIDCLPDSSEDIFDQAFPEDKPECSKELQVRKIIDQNLTKAQQNLVFDRYGAVLKLEDIRLKEIACTGVPVTQQAFTNRINRIKNKIRKLIEPVMES